MQIKKLFFQYLLPIAVVVILAMNTVGCQPTPTPDPTPVVRSPEPVDSTNPYDLVSQESLFNYLEALTSIQAYSGWRTAATVGEVEAFEYVEEQLGQFETLQAAGMELERQSFNVFITTEIWDARLYLTNAEGQEVEVPANGLRGSRYDPEMTIAFDSDGKINDSTSDPLSASGTPLLIRSADELSALEETDVQDRILFLDFALIDGYANRNYKQNSQQLLQAIDKGVAGLVLITQFHNQAGKSHGTVIGDGTIFQNDVPDAHIPILYARLEDLVPAGVNTWDDLEQIQSANMLLDADVLSPAPSGNLIAHIPGADSTHAIILGAHIDSPNSPGAFDDGSGSVALLEVARVLDQAQIQPPVDLYLAWFGSHENGIYGSAHFVATHQELLDRAIAHLQIDCLSHPLDSTVSEIVLETASYGHFGNESLPWPDFLTETAAAQGITTKPYAEYGVFADNSNFDAFNLPTLDMIYFSTQELETLGSGYIHYSGHLHDPYETAELAREVGDELEAMTKIALAAALETGRLQPNLRVSSASDKRALIVASHTEPASMVTTVTRELGMALAWKGFDVDLIPYSQTLTQSDLDNVGFILLLPTLDYPGPHEEIWTEAELTLLDTYVAEGGFLVVTNSANSFASIRPINDENEDVLAINPLLEPMGVAFQPGVIQGDFALSARMHPITAEVSYLALYSGNGVPFDMNTGVDLVQVNGQPSVGLVEYGDQGGEVLVVSDISLLFDSSGDANNLPFIKNIVNYAHTD